MVEAAKGLRDFAKANPLLVIKGGVLDGKAADAGEIVKLADLESREVLLAKLAGAMKASLANAAGTFAALPVQMARLLGALGAASAPRTVQLPPVAEAAPEAAAADATSRRADARSAADAPGGRRRRHDSRSA